MRKSMLSRFLREERGEFTVEASIVFVISFLVLLVLFCAGVVMFQQARLQSTCDRVASRGAMMFATRTTDMDSCAKTRSEFWNSDPYRYLVDSGYRRSAEEAIQTTLNQNLSEQLLELKGSSGSWTAAVKMGVFSRRVIVTGEKRFSVPFLSALDLDGSLFDYKIHSTAYIMDMPETIRNVDYVVDLLKRVDAVDKAMSKVGEVKAKAEEVIQKIDQKPEEGE